MPSDVVTVSKLEEDQPILLSEAKKAPAAPPAAAYGRTAFWATARPWSQALKSVRRGMRPSQTALTQARIGACSVSQAGSQSLIANLAVSERPFIRPIVRPAARRIALMVLSLGAATDAP